MSTRCAACGDRIHTSTVCPAALALERAVHADARPLSPEEKALAEAVDGKVTPSANAILWGRLLEWREWLRKEGRTA